MKATRNTVMSSSGLRARIRGMSLVEVMVAMVVLTVGMLGVASLFAFSLRSGSSAISRMQAVNLASDIADRIRANRRAGSGYTVTGAATDNKCVGASSVNCTPAEMAANDVFLWRQQIASAFPGGTASGNIAYTAASSPNLPSVYTITIAWKEQAQSATTTATDQQYVMRIEIPEN